MNPTFPYCQPIQSSSAAYSLQHFNAKKRRMSRAFTDNVNSFNVSNNIIFNAPDDESKILAWLSPLEPNVRHHDICNQRVDSIGDWLLETKEFRSWYNGSEKDGSDHAALFCDGDSGVGKSYIWYERPPVRNEQRALLLTPRDGSSVVIDYLCNQAIEKDLAVACFYYDFASREAQFPTNMLGSLVKQRLSGLGAFTVWFVCLPGCLSWKYRMYVYIPVRLVPLASKAY